MNNNNIPRSKRVYFKFIEAQLVTKKAVSPKHDLVEIFDISSAQASRIIKEYRTFAPDVIEYRFQKWYSTDNFRPILINGDEHRVESLSRRIISQVTDLWCD